jgi:hypothetical protein
MAQHATRPGLFVCFFFLKMQLDVLRLRLPLHYYRWLPLPITRDLLLRCVRPCVYSSVAIIGLDNMMVLSGVAGAGPQGQINVLQMALDK